jgi:hypothetical protein
MPAKGQSYEVVWDGRELTEALERDYADMKGDGWDLIWTPTSPLTTPWDELRERLGKTAIDPDAYVPTTIERPKRKWRGALRVLKDWSAEYGGSMVQHGGRLTSGGHWRISQRTMRPRAK